MSPNQELIYKAGEATGQVQVHTKTQKDIVEEYYIFFFYMNIKFIQTKKNVFASKRCGQEL